jgi:transcriptional regulator with XRE-family HTH domain
VTIASHVSECKRRMSAEAQTYRVHIGKRIQRLLKDRHISVKSVADQCGITAGAVSNWFSTGRVAKENLAVVCQMAGVDMASFIAGGESPADQKKGAPDYSPEALALAWLLDQIPGRLAKVQANFAATEAILRVLNGPDAAPTHTQPKR